jgi:ABC-2 type transport system ATP-binding protein
VPDLDVDHIAKRFGERVALNSATFNVREGEVFGFVGSNGAGKTTAMRIILGVLEPDSGQVNWDGRPIKMSDRRHIGYMPEERGLYPKMKVGEQLQYLAELHGLSAADARSNTEYWTATLGIADRRGDEVQKLSLGNQQRVQLAAALVHNPRLLVLDEPFSGLDPVAVDVMSGVLRERAAAGVPVVFSSHQLDLVERLCDRVGIISAGRMVAVGSIEELRRTKYPRWVVDGPPVEAWLPNLPGAQVISIDGSRTVLETGLGYRAVYDRSAHHGVGRDGYRADQPDPDGQDVLRAALAAGPVREFAPARPTLVDLFRDVVAEPPPETGAIPAATAVVPVTGAIPIVTGSIPQVTGQIPAVTGGNSIVSGAIPLATRAKEGVR